MIDPFLIIKILGFSAIAFVLAIAWTPLLTHFLYKYRLGKQIRSAEHAPVFAKMHAGKAGTPTMGGILIWVTVLVITLFFAAAGSLAPDSIFSELNFLSREQTYLPLGVFILAAVIGLADDIFGVFKIGGNGGGLNMKHRLLLYLAVALIGAYWFYFKLDWSVIHIPFFGNFEIGFWYIPIFAFIIVATSFSVNETDGLDGLAGGVLMVAFSAYIFVAVSQGKPELAVFCSVIVGALLAFLWFNIHPARFFMGDTGSMALGTTLGVIAFLTNSVAVLPIIGFVFVLETGSVILQLFWKKIFKKKLFLSAPIHHHFEALGWPESKVTMRFWVIGAVAAVIGLAIALICRG